MQDSNFLNLERIVDKSTYDNLIIVVIYSLVVFGGMLETNLINKVGCFGVDGVIVFKGLKINVTVQLINKTLSFPFRDSLYGTLV
jgi:hypothetical protein